MARGPAPKNKKKIIKKTRVKRNRFQHDQFKKISRSSWRKPKGIDGRHRRRFKGTPMAPKIGHGSNKKTRFLLPNGFYEMLVSNTSDLDMLLMHNREYCATIAHNVSESKRADIVERAVALNIRVTNAGAGLDAEDDE